MMCYSVREDLDVGEGIDSRVWSTGLMATCSLVALGVWHSRPAIQRPPLGIYRGARGQELGVACEAGIGGWSS